MKCSNTSYSRPFSKQKGTDAYTLTHKHRPKEIYKWITNEFQPPLLMLKDPCTAEPTSNVQRMDKILHESWDKVMRKYADTLNLTRTNSLKGRQTWPRPPSLEHNS